jgi:hypothetical protein
MVRHRTRGRTGQRARGPEPANSVSDFSPGEGRCSGSPQRGPPASAGPREANEGPNEGADASAAQSPHEAPYAKAAQNTGPINASTCAASGANQAAREATAESAAQGSAAQAADAQTGAEARQEACKSETAFKAPPTADEESLTLAQGSCRVNMQPQPPLFKHCCRSVVTYCL